MDASTDERPIKWLDIPVVGMANLISVAEPYLAHMILSMIIRLKINQTPEGDENVTDLANLSSAIHYYILMTSMFILFFGTMVSETVAIFSAQALGASH